MQPTRTEKFLYPVAKTMALTLLEYYKQTQDPLKRAIVREFLEGDVMRAMSFESISGSGLFYNREQSLPGVSFRGINEGYTENTGVVNPQAEALKICGGDLDVDTALIKMGSATTRSTQEQMKVRNIRLTWEQKFIKGDSDVDPREFDGLQKRITGSQLMSNADAGGALSLAKLDQLISQVENPTHLIISRRLRDRLTAASRSTTVGGFIMWEKNELGMKIAEYNGLPLLVDSIANPILPFTETSPDGSSSTSCSSIYCVSMGPNGLQGIQNGEIDVRDLGELDSEPKMRTRVEWLNAFAIFSGYSVARLYGITDAAVVV